MTWRHGGSRSSWFACKRTLIYSDLKYDPPRRPREIRAAEHDAMYKTPNGKKPSFFLPMKRAHLRSCSPTTYDPSRSHLRPSNLLVRSAATSLTGQPRTRKGHTYDPQTRLSAQREAVGESWKRQTCKRHIKDKTLEETRSPETPFRRQPGIQR